MFNLFSDLVSTSKLGYTPTPYSGVRVIWDGKSSVFFPKILVFMVFAMGGGWRSGLEGVKSAAPGRREVINYLCLSTPTLKSFFLASKK